jgi:hypothetical protein
VTANSAGVGSISATVKNTHSCSFTATISFEPRVMSTSIGWVGNVKRAHGHFAGLPFFSTCGSKPWNVSRAIADSDSNWSTSSAIDRRYASALTTRRSRRQ